MLLNHSLPPYDDNSPPFLTRTSTQKPFLALLCIPPPQTSSIAVAIATAAVTAITPPPRQQA